MEIAFPENEATTTVDITIYDDDNDEGTESFIAILREVRNVNLGYSVSTILITDDDEGESPVHDPPPSLLIIAVVRSCCFLLHCPHSDPPPSLLIIRAGNRLRF